MAMSSEDGYMRPKDPRHDYDKGNNYSGKTAAHNIPRARPISIDASSATLDSGMENWYESISGEDGHIPHKPGSQDRVSYL